MSDHDEVPLHQLSKQDLQDLINDFDLEVTVEELITALQMLSDGTDLDQVRAAIDDISKAA